jgi:hypothetical protein
MPAVLAVGQTSYAVLIFFDAVHQASTWRSFTDHWDGTILLSRAGGHAAGWW